MEDYFEKLTEIKAYILGFVIFNINKIGNDYLEIMNNNVPKHIQTELDFICKEPFVIKSQKVIQDICKQLSVDNLHNYHILNVSDFIKTNDRAIVLEFLKAYYEQNGKHNGKNHIVISSYNKKNLEAFSEFFGIPHTFSNVFNVFQLNYYDVNVIDVLGHIYKNHKYRTRESLFKDYLNLLNGEIPVLKYTRIHQDAVAPTKANPSDVGFDLSIIEVNKILTTKTSLHSAVNLETVEPVTTLYSTGIKLDIPVGYYVEIVPRSSISKSGYLLANSIGIIDCSYKGELLVALTKTSKDAKKIQFPFKCAQLIMRKQVFPEMVEVDDVGDTKRSEGGFGSSG